ncbi:MAG: GTPase domain-containing protein [bacterium]|nr:GTPase domain-containing protein [bacterium]
MSFINSREKEINCKIVYCGPALAGKSTSLRKIYAGLQQGKKQAPTLSQKEDRTLYFDFLPLNLGTIKGYKIRLHLYTAPGQTLYANSRKIILKGTDGIVFVADSQLEQAEANLESLHNLKKNLADQDIDWQTLPFLFQYNKQDLKNITPVEELNTLLNEKKSPHFATVATKGTGLTESLQTIAKQVLKELK